MNIVNKIDNYMLNVLNIFYENNKKFEKLENNNIIDYVNNDIINI